MFFFISNPIRIRFFCWAWAGSGSEEKNVGSSSLPINCTSSLMTGCSSGSTNWALDSVHILNIQGYRLGWQAGGVYKVPYNFIFFFSLKILIFFPKFWPPSALDISGKKKEKKNMPVSRFAVSRRRFFGVSKTIFRSSQTILEFHETIFKIS